MIINAERIVPRAQAVLYDGTNKRELFSFTNTNFRELKLKVGLTGTEEDYFNSVSQHACFMYKGTVYKVYSGNVVCIEDEILYVYDSLTKFNSLFKTL